MDWSCLSCFAFNKHSYTQSVINTNVGGNCYDRHTRHSNTVKRQLRQLILSVGLLLVFISFLFFARQAGTYMLLLTSGLLISLVSYLTLLFSKSSPRSKLTWTFIILLSAGVEYVIEPTLIKYSYLIYVSSNSDDLKAINDILARHDGEIDIRNDTIISKTSQLTSDEIQQLKNLRQKVDAYVIWKSNSDIYYGLYGFLDVRLGVAYVINEGKPTMKSAQTHLTDKWYY